MHLIFCWHGVILIIACNSQVCPCSTPPRVSCLRLLSARLSACPPRCQLIPAKVTTCQLVIWSVYLSAYPPACQVVSSSTNPPACHPICPLVSLSCILPSCPSDSHVVCPLINLSTMSSACLSACQLIHHIVKLFVREASLPLCSSMFLS